MACGSLNTRIALVACLLGGIVTPGAAHAARKHRPGPTPTQQQPTQQQPPQPAPTPTQPDREHVLPDLVVPPNSTPEPVIVLAAEPPPAPQPAQTAHWMLGARAGALFPQPFAPVGITGQGTFEVGYLLLPQLQLMGMLSYTQTHRSQTGQDARLAVPSYHTLSTAHQAGLALAAMGRLFDLDAPITPTLMLGLQLVAQNLQQQGTAGGADFGTTNQNSLQLGVYAASGIEMRAGPGRLVFQVSVTWVPAARPAPTGDRIGGLGADFGYRIAL